ncbi:hypothetical protein BUALT_Bualt05G0148600 [Buddleja alternifolia]|uniref:Phytochrome kinase substrate 1 n=1 Tax=Buddleja alternifolia TaxID=168488 RepID=A0AAV6XSI2_9LAMI|nr:hypothetical protein BUALT_Bualt05G0148600 [Buddleja alternifolia]
MSMPIVTLSSSSNTSPPENTEKSRDPSFSSYLNGAEESFVLKLRSTSTHCLDSTVTPYDHIFPGKSKTKDTEIDVFDAKKYFDGSLNHHQLNKDDPLEVSAMEKLPRVKTPSIRSESSWNSRNALLHGVPKNQHPVKTEKKSFFTRIGCNCSCSDENSVKINDYSGENCSRKTRPISENSKQGVTFDDPENDFRFSFPVFNPGTEKMQVQEDDSTFVLDEWKNSLSLEKQLSMLTWNSISPGLSQEIKIPSNASNGSDTDASSELFEIENLSKGCYAPSEASIEWSVVTASVVDFSVLSDSEELRSIATTTGRPRKVGPVKGHSSILSGCKSQKAVRVAGDEQRANDLNPRRRVNSESFNQRTTFHEGRIGRQ